MPGAPKSKKLPPWANIQPVAAHESTITGPRKPKGDTVVAHTPLTQVAKNYAAYGDYDEDAEDKRKRLDPGLKLPTPDTGDNLAIDPVTTRRKRQRAAALRGVVKGEWN